MKTPSITTRLPRSLASEHSDCQTGTLVLSAPTPSPTMKRPITNCGSWKLVHCKISPTRVQVPARKAVFRLPSESPIQEHARDPARAPRVRVATTTPFESNVSSCKAQSLHVMNSDLDCTVRIMLCTLGMDRIDGRERISEIADAKQTADTR